MRRPWRSMRLPILRAVALLFLLVNAGQVAAQVPPSGATQPGDLVNWPLLMPSDCAGCHKDYVAGLDYEPFDTWAGTMMANSARDPLFWAALDIANQDAAGVGELCIRCHSPRAWLEGRSSTADGSAMLGFPDEPDNDFEGIDCHTCHRMYEGGGAFTENGQYWIDDGTPTTEPPRRGPYDDANSPHEWVYSAYHESSDLCGTCHDLRNPLVEFVDGAGVGQGTNFPEQLTYTEWAQSDFAVEGTTCQDCHMPAQAGYACDRYNPFRPEVFRHDFAGGNTFVPQILKGEYGAALGRTASYDYTIAQAFNMLQNGAATVAIAAPAAAVEDQNLMVTVTVTNNTGHKLPTGYPEGRRMWLYIQVQDALGATVFESGGYDDASATLLQDPQVMIYETRHGIFGAGESFHLVQNNYFVKDTRIPPRGMIPNHETQPVGATYPDQGGGVLAHWSDVAYSIPVPAGVPQPITVTATLRYQTSSREYIEFLRDENTSGPDPQDRNYPAADDRGTKIYNFWQTYGKSAPVDMTSDQVVLPVVGAPVNIVGLVATPAHNQVDLSWTIPAGDVAGIKIMRKEWGDYPEFGGPPNLIVPPAYPTTHAAALSAGWTEVYDGLASAFSDNTFNNSSRDVYYYAAFAYNSGNILASGDVDAQGRATSYRLGDLGVVGDPLAADGLVDGVNDLPVFSAAFGACVGEPGYDPTCDFAPADLSSTGIPAPSDCVDFSDLVVLANAFDGGAPKSDLPMAKSVDERTPVRIELGASETRNGRQYIPLRLTGAAGRLKAMHLDLDAPGLTTNQVALLPGSAMPSPHFTAAVVRGGRLWADWAVLGRDLGLEDDGLVATLVLPEGYALPDQVPVTELRAIGQSELLAETVVAFERTARPVVAHIALSPNVPNPFNPRTSIELRLDQPGRVDVAIYDVSGRRVRTLFSGHLEAGTHPLQWNGMDGNGRAVSSGVYLCRAHGDAGSVTRRMTLVR